MDQLCTVEEKKCNIGSGVREFAYRALMSSNISEQAMIQYIDDCVQYTLRRCNATPQANIRITLKGYVTLILPSRCSGVWIRINNLNFD